MSKKIIRAPYAHVASLIYDQPLMVTPQRLRVILDALKDRLGLTDLGEVQGNLRPWEFADAEHRSSLFELLPAEREPDDGKPRSYSVLKNGTALIPVIGTLAHRASWLDAMSGLTSYDRIRSSIQEALNDNSIRRIALEVDSPGGSASGVFDLADMIQQARGTKQIIAVVNGQATSAAQLIAAAADEVWATRTSLLGSVGVIATHFDYSAMADNEGVKVTHVFAGARKADLSPYFPLSERAESWLQEMVDETYALFVNSIAKYRGLKASAVRAQEAGVFMGKEGVEQGLADKIMTVDEAARRLVNGQLSRKRDGGKEMRGDQVEQTKEAQEDPKQATDAPAAPAAPAASAEAPAMPAAPVAPDPAAKTELELERERAAGIHAACKAVKREDLAMDLFLSGATVEQAQARIATAMAASQVAVDTALSPGSMQRGEKKESKLDTKAIYNAYNKAMVA